MVSGRQAALCVLLIGSFVLSGCVPLVLGGGAAAGVVAVDRRTSGTQLEDQTIEFKTSAAFRENSAHFQKDYHINVNSYNRRVLLTGEVGSEQDKATAERIAKQVENVEALYNELAVMPNSSLGQRSNDTLLTGQVRSWLIGTDGIPSNSVKVTSERGIVYLQGLVTKEEADIIVERVRTISGVHRVVRVFEYISPTELTSRQPDKEARQTTAPHSSNDSFDYK